MSSPGWIEDAQVLRPREVSWAHHGGLFLDELPERRPT
jgi:predicted ATPase with chaperone activity